MKRLLIESAVGVAFVVGLAACERAAVSAEKGREAERGVEMGGIGDGGWREKDPAGPRQMPTATGGSGGTFGTGGSGGTFGTGGSGGTFGSGGSGGSGGTGGSGGSGGSGGTFFRMEDPGRTGGARR